MMCGGARSVLYFDYGCGYLIMHLLKLTELYKKNY